jgi:hypothetical protein
MECKHFSGPALMRDFASIGEPVAVEAKEELFRIVSATVVLPVATTAQIDINGAFDVEPSQVCLP